MECESTELESTETLGEASCCDSLVEIDSDFLGMAVLAIEQALKEAAMQKSKALNKPEDLDKPDLDNL